MRNLQDAVLFHLGREVPSSNPTYYELLGIQLSSDDVTVKNAWKRAAESWNTSDRKTHPEGAKQVGALLKQAQQVLLEPSRRAAYDAELLARERSQAKAAGEKVGKAVDTVLFPQGDPFEPFDAERFIANLKQSDLESADSRYQAILQAIRPSTTPPPLFESLSYPTEDHGLDYESSVTLQTAEASELLPANIDVTRAGLGGSTGGSAIQTRITQQRAAQRKKEQRSQIVIVVASVTLGGMLLLWILFFQGNNRDGSYEIAVVPQSETTEVDVSANTMDSAERSDELAAETPVTMVNELAGHAPDEPDESVGATMEVSQEEVAIWATELTQAREALKRQDFSAFNERIAAAQAIAVRGDRQAKSERLAYLGDLLQRGVEAFEAGRKRVVSERSLRLSNVDMEVVSANNAALTLRVGGRPQEYSWEHAPLGIKLAILDLGLSSDAPQELATRGVWLHYQSDPSELRPKRIEAYFSASLGKEGVPQELPLAFDENYD